MCIVKDTCMFAERCLRFIPKLFQDAHQWTRDFSRNTHIKGVRLVKHFVLNFVRRQIGDDRSNEGRIDETWNHACTNVYLSRLYPFTTQGYKLCLVFIDVSYE